MKVLYVLNNYPPNIIGGAEVIAHSHLKELKKIGFACSAFSGDHNPEYPPFSSRNEMFEGIEINRISISPNVTSEKIESFSSEEINKIFKRKLEKLKPKIVHFHNLPGLSIDLIDIASSCKILTVLTVHDHWGFCHRQTLINTKGEICKNTSACEECQKHVIDKSGLQRPITYRNIYVKKRFKKIDALISPSYYLLNQYIQNDFAPKTTRVISYGVDLEKFQPYESKESKTGIIKFGIACYLGEHKGIKIVLESIKKLHPTVRAKFIFAGKGPLIENILAFQKNDPNGKLVEYKGSVSVSNMPEFFRHLDVFICASVWPENQPLTIMESMASGLAVIATDVGGVSELVENSYSGILIPKGDPIALAMAINYYLKNPEDVRKHGEIGGRVISKNGLRKQVVSLSNLYKELEK